jgi:hypothetical protein
MDADEIVAGDRLIVRIPDAQTWMTRVGYGYIRRLGAGRARPPARSNSAASCCTIELGTKSRHV